MRNEIDDTLKAKKQEFRRRLIDYVEKYKSFLKQDVDTRLYVYFCELVNDDTTHNIYEYGAAVKFFRMLGMYDIDTTRAKKFIRFYESLYFSGLKGRRKYRLTPIQVFQFVSIYLFLRDDGTRLVRDAILFVPRKFSKTTGAASIAVYDLLFGDSNAEIYIAANSADQSSRCFRECKNIIQQFDRDNKMLRKTQSEISWNKNDFGKESSLTRLTAGGKNKDGANASLFIYDEYGSARYVKDRSDGAELFNVMTSSMGARKEPLTVIITTASRVTYGPFEPILNNAKEDLIKENPESDSTFSSIFCPEPWMTHEDFGKPTTWKMCNPHIGITIQPDFYADEWQRAQRDQEKMREYLCKYLNVFLTGNVKDWITADEIRARSIPCNIESLKDTDEDSFCISALDFSKGDDLNVVVYMVCFNEWKTDPSTGLQYRYFFDIDAWISAEKMETNTNRGLYERWFEKGYLRKSPGSIIDESLVVQRVGEVCDIVPMARIGFDPYDSQRYVSALTELCIALGADPKKIIKPVSQTWGSFNAPTQAFRELLLMDNSPIAFSENPILPWNFQNCYLEEDRNECVKPVKKSAAQKIDGAICALMCIKLLNEMQISGK